MAVRSFDRKFGAEFLESLPGSPGVYLVYDQEGELIYVGKAVNLKRRLSQYRNTIRRKKHRRMRGIVKEAARIEIQCAENHLDACLTETMLIQKHRPRWKHRGRVLVSLSADRDPIRERQHRVLHDKPLRRPSSRSVPALSFTARFAPGGSLATRSSL